MKMTWFQHPACTTEEADELVKQYRRRGKDGAQPES